MRLFLVLVTLGTSVLAQDILRPPGHRPLESSVHALVGARVVTSPGKELEKATIVLRDGRIEAVGADVQAPADARVHDMAGMTIYAGFIDAHVSFAKSTARKVEGDEGPPIDALDLTAGAGSGFLGTTSAAGEPGTKSVVTPEHRMAREYAPEKKALDALRTEGFTAANIVPSAGVIRGISTFVALNSSDPDVAIIKPETFQHIAIDTPKSGDDSKPEAYPGSLMGVVSVIRQTLLDTQFQATDHAHFAQHPNDRQRPPFKTSLDVLLPVTKKAMPVLFEPASALMVDRSIRIAREFGLQPVILATGQEWRRPDLVREAEAPFIVPVDYPEVPKLPEDEDWAATPLDQLRVWDHAPGNASLLRREGREIALTTHGLGKRASFRPNIRLAIARGLSENDAIAALTTSPAKICGVAEQLGTIEKGKLAHLTIFEKGRAFDEESRVNQVWIDGRQFLAPMRDDKKPAKKDEEDDKEKKDEKDKPKLKLRHQLTASEAQKDRGPLLTPKSVFIKSATIWTCGPQGKIESASLLITEGKVKVVGPNQEAPADAHVIDLPGIHVTPGLIDCHSHSMIMGGVNEGTLPSTAMVRVADVINSEAETIHQQLAGGLTTANQLHGSANPIGGQNCVIKLREGESPEGLKFAGAIEGIKFALGENVKQANWGDAFKSRFPQSRMGVPAFHTNRFTAAQHYMAALEKARNGGPPVRRDLELEAIAEIIRGERLIHCHSYRQDEILAFLRVMEGFKVRVGTLQHILEGYKVADEIAKHGAGASAFSDWWAYKFEVIDAIPHAGSIMRERGVLVSFNSDSSDHARRLNLEAAKAVKYGGTSEEEALKFVTINPAKQLRIDKQVGSLEAGKDADFVIWSGHPLSTSSMCLQTWIDGKQYFERDAAHRRAESRKTEHLALVEKAKTLASDAKASSDDDKAKGKFFFRTLEQRQGHMCVDCCMDREMSWKN
ncbi:amidohydrolase family protein [Brevifollis gellanilyticus]|uniref:Amidohydrolase-related domain-containing protein n=1 Tax=Brevifollis gellanilyticus TaxID=748831 RepID=A0A512M8E1_9BACT|nr:amidohydrolase family protein [Brevifollis gellanilyticus]GEP43008.1 hypothetical protein BGE01nite_22990 [Brevifollis gellanilyticus]